MNYSDICVVSITAYTGTLPELYVARIDIVML